MNGMTVLRLTTPSHGDLGPASAYGLIRIDDLDNADVLSAVTSLTLAAYRDVCQQHDIEPYADGLRWDFIPAIPGSRDDTVTWNDASYYAGLARVAKMQRAIALIGGDT